MLTDVFAAGTDALPRYREAGFPDPHNYGFPTVRARGLEPVALAILDALLSHVSIDEAVDTAVMTPVDQPDLYQAPVITALSPRTVRTLPAVSAEKLAALAADWTQHPELAGLGAEPAHAWLTRVQELCRDTVSTGNLIFVWNCL